MRPFPFGDATHDFLIATPEKYVANLEKRTQYISRSVATSGVNLDSHFRTLYVENLMQLCVGTIWNDKDLSVPQRLNDVSLLVPNVTSLKKRESGEDWPVFGYTMVGSARMRSAHDLLADAFAN